MICAVICADIPPCCPFHATGGHPLNDCREAAVGEATVLSQPPSFRVGAIVVTREDDGYYSEFFDLYQEART